jgi:hypothetical protein
LVGGRVFLSVLFEDWLDWVFYILVGCGFFVLFLHAFTFTLRMLVHGVMQFVWREKTINHTITGNEKQCKLRLQPGMQTSLVAQPKPPTSHKERKQKTPTNFFDPLLLNVSEYLE